MHVELATISTISPIRGHPRLVVRPRSEYRMSEQGPRFPANTHTHTRTHARTHTHTRTHTHITHTHTHTHTCIRRQSGRFDISLGNRGDVYTLCLNPCVLMFY